MKKLLKKFSSFKTSLVLLAALIIMLAGATFIEKYYGTEAARRLVYHSPALFTILILTAANFFMLAWKSGHFKSRRLGMIMTHLSFVIIMAGAAVTHFFSFEGIIHLREGDGTDRMVIRGKDGKTETRDLPFSVYLDDFILKRYPGSGSPSSYESFVTITSETEEVKAHIFMNNVLDIQGYRLYQASFDQDEMGSILSVSHDSCGRAITYTGYLTLFIGLILSLTDRNGRFRRLYRKLGAIQAAPLMLVLALGIPSNTAEAAGRIDSRHAEGFGRLAVQSADGRMMPVNTFSSEIMRKICKEDEIIGLDPDRFLLSLMADPGLWSGIPCISVRNDELAGRYGLDVPYSSYQQMFDTSGNYKLRNELEAIYRKDPSERTKRDKDVLKLDERVNIFNMLASRRLLRIFPLPEDTACRWYAPGDDLGAFVGKDSMFVSRIFDWYLEEVSSAVVSGDWEQADKVLGMIDTYQQAKATGVDISEKKLETEVLYNRLNPFHICRISYLVLGFISLLLSLLVVSGHIRTGRMKNIIICLAAAAFAIHMAGMGTRWYIAGHAPWTNSYETMVYISWATVAAGFLSARRNMLVFSLAVLFGGVILFVSGMSWMDPQITTLVPVLRSPWLMFHVATITAAYGFFGLSCLMGLVNLIFMSAGRTKSGKLMQYVNETTILNEMSLWVGLVLLTIGTFIGAVWANESWGRYWGWDPKETWALITVIVYTVVTHIHLLKSRSSLWLFNLLSVIAFLAVLMTFFGVTYLLSGMHSYA